jgi:hypothetical protein
MSSEATFSISVAYPDPTDPGDNPIVLKPHAQVARAPFTDESAGAAVLADTSVAGTEVAIDFGAITNEVTGFYVRNETGQDLGVGFNGAVLATAAATFETAAGALKTATTTFETAAGVLSTAITTQMATLTGFSGSDPAADIVTAIASANTALVTAQGVFDTAKTALDTAKSTYDTAKTAFDAVKTAPALTLPTGAVLSIATPTPATATALTALSLFATATQSGDGSIFFKAFGSSS